jgi:hypothetical protein
LHIQQGNVVAVAGGHPAQGLRKGSIRCAFANARSKRRTWRSPWGRISVLAAEARL